MKKFVLSLVLSLVATVASSSMTMAGYLTGGATFNSANTSLTSGLPTLAQTITFGGATAASGSFSIGQTWGTLSVGAFSVPAGTLMSITGDAGTFEGEYLSDIWNPSSGTNGTRALAFTGVMKRAGFLDTPADLNISITKTSTQYSVAVTLGMNPPAAAVPEPASIAIFGLGAAGFAVRRLRRK